ncbi:MAG: hypothetical protein ACK4UV_05765 [Ignavibacterium sp.]
MIKYYLVRLCDVLRALCGKRKFDHEVTQRYAQSDTKDFQKNLYDSSTELSDFRQRG